MKTYNKLDEYITQERIDDIRRDFQAKVDFLLTKYRDKTITSFINAVQSADMKDLYKQDVWKCRFEFVAQDISNIDKHQGYSNNILKEFFNTICNDLSVKMVDYSFQKVSDDGLKVYFILSIKNPMQEKK